MRAALIGSDRMGSFHGATVARRPPDMWLTPAKALTRLAELDEPAGRVFTLENLNTAVDHPATPFAAPPIPSLWSRPSTTRTCE